MTREQVRGFIEALATAHPDPRSELTFVDPYTLLIAVVLSAQATDASVNRATEVLFRDAATPDAMVRLGIEGGASVVIWWGQSLLEAETTAPWPAIVDITKARQSAR